MSVDLVLVDSQVVAQRIDGTCGVLLDVYPWKRSVRAVNGIVDASSHVRQVRERPRLFVSFERVLVKRWCVRWLLGVVRRRSSFWSIGVVLRRVIRVVVVRVLISQIGVSFDLAGLVPENPVHIVRVRLRGYHFIGRIFQRVVKRW